MRKLSTALLIAGVAALVALAGCGGGGGGGGGTTPDPPPTGNLIVTGRVINHLTGNGVQGVIVRFGTANRSATTNANGQFSIDTQTTSALLAYSGSLFPYTFTVSTAGLPQPPIPPGVIDWTPYYPATFSVTYTHYPSWPGNYPQDSVRLPDEVLNGSTSSLGTIIVYDASDIPPIPF